MADTSTLSDGACAVFAFAAYHQLQSGQPVTKVIIDDGHGHKADETGMGELEQIGLTTRDGNSIVFTERGLAVLARVIEQLKATIGGA